MAGEDLPVRLTLLGVGAMNSPRFRPAGLLVRSGTRCLVIDGGDERGVPQRVDAWLVCDEHAELMARLRRLAAGRGAAPAVASHMLGEVAITPLPVEHTSRPTYGYLLATRARRVGWAPEFWRYPEWANDLDLLFADAAGWSHPIRFRGGVGGHACATEVARAARAHSVRRLVFAHLGRPTIAAIDAGARPDFGEFGVEGQTFSP